MPWNTAKSEAQVKAMMEEADISSLSAEAGLEEVGEILLRCRDTRIDETPDYATFRQLLTRMQGRGATKGKTSASTKKAKVPVGGGKGKGKAKRRSIGAEKNDKETMDVAASSPAKRVAHGRASLKVAAERCNTSRATTRSSPRRPSRRDTVFMEDSGDDDVDDEDVGPMLVVKKGTDLGSTYPLRQGEQSFGRGEATHTIDDQFASELHATIKVMMPTGRSRATKLSICDEDTTNGTKVNGKKLSPGVFVALKGGDRIKIGATVLEVCGL